MQKLMICMHRTQGNNSEAWHGSIDQLVKSHLHEFSACRYAVADQDVQAAESLKLSNTRHPKDAVISLWLDNFYSLDNFIADLSELGPLQAYGVVVSNCRKRLFEAGRQSGFCQMSFLRKHASQSHPQWLNQWLGESTKIALKTQGSTSLDQNIVCHSLPFQRSNGEGWSLVDGITEENFPAVAMTCRESFYAASGNRKKYLKNEEKLIASCLKFIDFDAFDCVPMSQYVLKV